MASERYCQQLWATAVKLKANCCCEQCGRAYAYDDRGFLAAHHLHFRSRCGWHLQFITDLGVALCSDCHTFAHSHEQEFRDQIFAKVEFERSGRILTLLECAYDLPEGRPDYVTFARELRDEIKQAEEIYEDWLVGHDPDPRHGNYGSL